VAGGWQTARAALAAQRLLAAGASGAEASFLQAKLGTARFYADHVLVKAPGLARTVVSGAEGALALSDEQF
jgi:acyl-CoA dehydrogenase